MYHVTERQVFQRGDRFPEEDLEFPGGGGELILLPDMHRIISDHNALSIV